MSRFNTLLLGVLYASQLVSSAPSNLHTVLSPFSFSPSVEILQSPVTKVETIRLEPQLTKSVSTSASAVAIARAPQFQYATRTVVPLVQRVESYSSGDSSNSEIRNLLRNLLSELRNGNTRSSAFTAPALSDSYGPPSRQAKSGALTAPTDSYGAPPRNTISDPNAPSYPDSFDNSRRNNNIDDFDKPEKVQQSSRLIQEAPVQYRELVRTVYQPVYVPYQQYAQPEQLFTVAQPVQQYAAAVPTRINTGSSAVAISTIHSSPAYAIQQQQQYSLPLVQQQSVQLQQQPFAAAYASAGGQVFEETSGYVKK